MNSSRLEYFNLISYYSKFSILFFHINLETVLLLTSESLIILTIIVLKQAIVSCFISIDAKMYMLFNDKKDDKLKKEEKSVQSELEKTQI